MASSLRWLLASSVTLFLLWAQLFHGAEALNGTVSIHNINSTILGFPRQIQVYLPPGYNQTTESYPVIYFLHGFIGDHTYFSYLNEIVDDLIFTKKILPVVIIKPNGALNGSVPPIGSLWANSVVNGRFEDFLLQEVLPWAESSFRISRDPRERLAMGHSFGASAALRFTIQKPDIFGSVACHSGFVKMDSWLVALYVNTAVGDENNNGTVVPSFKKFTLFLFTGAKAWSPNVNAPYSVDLPMINNGSRILRDDIVAKWESYSPHYIIKNSLAQIRAKPPHMLYFDIGAADELLLLQPNLDFAGFLLDDRIQYTMKIYNGPHNSEPLLRERFRESVSSWNDYLVTIVPEPSSSSDPINNEKSDSSSSFPYGMVIGIVVGVFVAALLAIAGVYLFVTSKWHVLFLDKKLTVEQEED